MTSGPMCFSIAFQHHTMEPIAFQHFSVMSDPTTQPPLAVQQRLESAGLLLYSSEAVCPRCEGQTELAFINVPFGSTSFWTLLLVDFVMLVMRDADLWDDVANALCVCALTPHTLCS